MMTSKWNGLLLGMALVLVGNTVAKEEIKGSIFIVTQGGQAIKLALAQVYVVSPAGVEIMKQNKAQAERAVITRIEEHAQLTDEDIKRMEAESVAKAEQFEKARAAFNKFESEVHAPLINRWGEKPNFFQYRDVQSRQRAIDEWQANTRYDDWNRLRIELVTAESSLASAKVGIEPFVEELKSKHEEFARRARQEVAGISPPAGLLPIALSDADGKFTVKTGSDEWIYVHCSRKIPAENYDWLLPVKLLDGEPVLFSNHNLYQSKPLGEVR